jgi:hypothetical protein
MIILKPDHPLSALSDLTVDLANFFDILNPEEVEEAFDLLEIVTAWAIVRHTKSPAHAAKLYGEGLQKAVEGLEGRNLMSHLH